LRPKLRRRASSTVQIDEDNGNYAQAETSRGDQALVAADDCAIGSPRHDGLDHAELADAAGECLRLRVAHSARIRRVETQLADRHYLDVRSLAFSCHVMPSLAQAPRVDGSAGNSASHGTPEIKAPDPKGPGARSFGRPPAAISLI
jgi:hypothetical protein